jgi:hypothetical protein
MPAFSRPATVLPFLLNSWSLVAVML